MPGGDRQNADELLAGYLASGMRIEDAARKAGVAESTAYRRRRNPKFQQRVQELRNEMLGRAVGILADGASEASATLWWLVQKAKSESVRLGACRALLEMGTRLRESAELAEQVADLRRQLEELKNNGHRNAAAGTTPDAEPAGQPEGGADLADAETAAGGSEPDPDGRGLDPGPLADDVTPIQCL